MSVSGEAGPGANELVSPRAIEFAARGLEGVAARTPLLPADWLSDAVGGEVRLKCESLQRAGSFKLRGAYTMISRLPDVERRRGVITYSSGNHAQAVALAARLFGVPAVVVMPTTAPAVKVRGARGYGAEVVFEGTTSTERQRRAESLAAERGLAIVPPFEHPDIIAGQGTVGREILEDWPDVDAVLAPIGGGGLLSGIAAWIRRAHPDCVIIGVEPEGAASMRGSLDAGEPATLASVDTIADGLMPVRPGELTFGHVHELVDDVVTVDDAAIRDAASRLLSRSKLMVEFSGAATTAALLSGAFDGRERRTAVVVSGGNMDSAAAAELLSAEPAPPADD